MERSEGLEMILFLIVGLVVLVIGTGSVLREMRDATRLGRHQPPDNDDGDD